MLKSTFLLLGKLCKIVKNSALEIAFNVILPDFSLNSCPTYQVGLSKG